MWNITKKFVAPFVIVLALALASCGPSSTTSAPTTAPAANTSAPAAATSAPVSGEKKVINLYSDDDVNITDWLSNKAFPAFEKKFPQYKMNLVNVRGVGGGAGDIANRALAALQSNSDPQAELLSFDCTGKPDLVKAGLWQKLDATNVPNAKNVIKAATISDCSQAYRGSQVLLAYDSAKIKDNEVPRTFPDLIKWVKAHPGQFVYCRPDKGGSGGNFVIRAIYEVTGKDPTKFKPGDPDPALLAKYDEAWALLREMHPFIYDKGSYPSGNTPVIQLLANGSVSLASMWSDQGLQALQKGVLPSTVKLVQFSDLPMPGGYSYFSVPKNAKNVAGALEFINFVLTPDMQVSVVKDIGGFPALDWGQLPPDLRQQYTSVITDNVPNWPGGKYSDERTKGWYEKVATNIDPKAP